VTYLLVGVLPDLGIDHFRDWAIEQELATNLRVAGAFLRAQRTADCENARANPRELFLKSTGIVPRLHTHPQIAARQWRAGKKSLSCKRINPQNRESLLNYDLGAEKWDAVRLSASARLDPRARRGRRPDCGRDRERWPARNFDERHR
jgi:hypothetical protein